MLSKAIYNEIKEGLKSGLYRSIRLVRKDPEGDIYLIKFNRIKSDITNTLARLDHFKKLLDKTLEPGQYEIQATGNLIDGMIEKFPVQVFEKKVIVTDPTKHLQEHLSEFELQEDNMISEEKYVKLLEEKATLEGMVTTLTLERNWYLKRLTDKENEKDQGLADKSSAGNVLAELAKESIPGMINLAQEFLNVRKMEAKLKTDQRDGKIKIKKAPAGNVRQINPEQVILYYYNLLETDPDKANHDLDLLETNNPALYQIVSESLWPEGEEEEEEEEQMEEEEEEEEQMDDDDDEEEEEEEEPTGT